MKLRGGMMSNNNNNKKIIELVDRNDILATLGEMTMEFVLKLIYCCGYDYWG